MEKALFVNDVEKIEMASYFDRIYYGSESCPDIIDIRSVKHILEKLGTNNLTLVTSIIPFDNIEILNEILAYLYKQNRDSTEIVINDIGLLHYIHNEYPEFKLNIGRLMSRNFTSSFSLDPGFLYEYNITRVEYQEVYDIFESGEAKMLSYYFPYKIVATSRFCKLQKISDQSGRNTCQDICRKESFYVKNAVYGDTILQEKTFYVYQGLINISPKRALRLIFQPLDKKDYRIIHDMRELLALSD